ncbi:MAG: (d)CMP kinase [Candidatus Abyssubacteria bacterium]|nr:(d)CMP kinase [Candidatus Abyssubacteria bacterium]
MKRSDHIIVAIDGPAGAGKSTAAKEVARRFSLLYIDSGAMYRAVAWKALQKKVDVADEKAVTEMASNMKIDLRPADGGTRVFVDGKEVTDAIRTPEVTDASSKMATIGAVRGILVEHQRAMGRSSGVVMEGRDIGTVVFPDTPFKFYLDASVGERARRRKKDLEQAGYEVEPEQLERDVAKRDKRDSTREVAPLRRAEDAMSIDTTGMTIDEVVQAISKRVDAIASRLSEEGS